MAYTANPLNYDFDIDRRKSGQKTRRATKEIRIFKKAARKFQRAAGRAAIAAQLSDMFDDPVEAPAPRFEVISQQTNWSVEDLKSLWDEFQYRPRQSLTREAYEVYMTEEILDY